MVIKSPQNYSNMAYFGRYQRISIKIGAKMQIINGNATQSCYTLLQMLIHLLTEYAQFSHFMPFSLSQNFILWCAET